MSTKRSFQLLSTLLLCATGCAPTESELFIATQEALAEGSGESCEDDLYAVDPSEVNIDDGSHACSNSLACVAVGEYVAERHGIDPTEGVCSCPCDGPEGATPYCTCGEGFRCVALIEDLRLGFGPTSYCMSE